MSAFATHFRQHVTPRLYNLAQAEAACFAAGLEDFADCRRVLWRYAFQFGAAFLPDDIFHDLNDWLLTTLSEAIEEKERTSAAPTVAPVDVGA